MELTHTTNTNDGCIYDDGDIRGHFHVINRDMVRLDIKKLKRNQCPTTILVNLPDESGMNGLTCEPSSVDIKVVGSSMSLEDCLFLSRKIGHPFYQAQRLYEDDDFAVRRFLGLLIWIAKQDPPDGPRGDEGGESLGDL